MDPKPTPSIPPDIMDSILGLGKNVSIIIGLLPLLLIKLIFQMLAQIVNMFLQIAGVLGLPSIPFPLTLIPQALSACDDIYDAIMLFPPTIEGVLKRKLEKMLQQIAAMMNGPSDLIDQIRKLNPDIANLASCPKRGTASTSAKVNAIKSQISDVELELKYLRQSASSKEYSDKLKSEIQTKTDSLNSIKDPEEFENVGAEITEMNKKLSEYESLSRDSNNDQELIKKLENKLTRLNADLKAAEEEEKKKQEEKAKQDEKKKAEIEKMKKKYEKEEEERNKVKPCGICGRKDSSNILCPFGSAGK